MQDLFQDLGPSYITLLISELLPLQSQILAQVSSTRHEFLSIEWALSPVSSLFTSYKCQYCSIRNILPGQWFVCRLSSQVELSITFSPVASNPQGEGLQLSTSLISPNPMIELYVVFSNSLQLLNLVSPVEAAILELRTNCGSY